MYIGSIADQHKKLATQSILAGKPTVVEKPITLTAKDASDVIELARVQNVFFMEGMWTRCFPAMKEVQKVIQSGSLGEIVSVQGDFGWNTKDCEYPSDRIWNLESGGMTLDIGMYMVQLGQVAYGSDATVETIQAMGKKKHGVDHTVLANIMYKVTKSNNQNSEEAAEEKKETETTDRTGFLQFYVTGEANTEERVVIQGTKGRIILDPPAHVPSRVTISYDTGRGASKTDILEFPLPNDSHETWNYPGSIGFTYQIQDVNEALRQGLKECPSFTHQSSLQVCTILDEILNQIHGPNDKK